MKEGFHMGAFFNGNFAKVGLTPAVGLGLGPSHNLGQRGVNVFLINVAGDVISLAPKQHDGQPVFDFVDRPGQGIAFSGEVQHQAVVPLNR